MSATPDVTATMLLRKYKLQPLQVIGVNGRYEALFPLYAIDDIRRWYNRSRGKTPGLLVTGFGADFVRNVAVLHFKVVGDDSRAHS